MTRRENLLRTIRFERPDWIPVTFAINPACWHHYDQEELQDLIEEHPRLFPDFKRREKVSPEYLLNQRADAPYTDPWGCVWETTDNGITGSVHLHPLADWNSFTDFIPPSPEVTDGTYPIDWETIKNRVRRTRLAGGAVVGGLPHGHTFLRLQDLRGYENLMFDMADDEPQLVRLIEMVEEFNHGFVQRWLSLEPDVMSYPEDLGMQIGPMLSPDDFRRWIKPVYRRLMAPARERECVVHMHSDGDIRTLVDDLIEGGVEIINLQDLVNGIDWIADRFAGSICIDLDIDRQEITPRGTEKEVEDLIRREVHTLGGRQGGLMLTYGLYPGVPVGNIRALMDALERHMGLA